MSLCLIQILKEWLAILYVILSPLFIDSKSIDTLIVENNVSSGSLDYVVEYKDYDKVIKYNSNLPVNTTNIITQGEVGLTYNVNGENILLREPINEVVEIGTGAKTSYKGSVTGYGGDCLGCSGNVSCRTPEGTYSLLNSGEYYTDSSYGELRIIAADTSLFECGTVLDVKLKNENVRGIVLDTGSALRFAWKNEGRIVLDIAFQTQSDPDIYNITDKSGTVEIDVKRWGW
ncbi:MAG: hypothetical protein NC181_00865 [Clostridium sp.]|nr:hypothetical protein [Clostridium sp.]MCM1443789.1 hypothetical protein [Candidatus Amulumruptor caecigallinarius]